MPTRRCSTLLDAPEYEHVRINTTGAYSGVGLELVAEDGHVRIGDPVEGSPAARAGVRAGDRLVSVDGDAVDAQDLDAITRRLRGRAGTVVKLVVEREGVAAPLGFELKRGQVQVHTVRGELLEPGYGYVRLEHFSDHTMPELERVVRRLAAEAGGRLQGLVLDLRNNPGGVLEAGVDVADAFLDRGVIVSASGRAVDAEFTMHAAPGDLLEGAKLTLLVNAGSASASEIVAGALRDNRRATIVGRTTYGKGSVQTVMPLSGGRALKITTPRYYTPSGESINEKGVRPDVVVPRDLVKLEPASLATGGTRHAASDPEVAIALGTLKGEPRELLVGSPATPTAAAAGSVPDRTQAAAKPEPVAP
ncbi:MAG: S41 family peptidase [Pseudomonadota bacterium]